MPRTTKYILILLCALVIFLSFATPNVSSQDPTPTPTPSPTAVESASPTPTPSQIDKIELHQALLDLSNLATVMCVAAHPDDEDGTSLTVLRRKYGINTVSLFSTYGEGGQNAIGPELYEELGVIRAHETEKASQIQGSQPHFLQLKDFGFSKSADETFNIWGHDEALRRMVAKIRELRPDVIITNHDVNGGHGHHQATGRLLVEAFDAAADRQRFPEQLKPQAGKEAVGPWQPKRLFVRVRRPTADSNAPAEKLVVIDPNERDELRGTSYGEQALTALQQHASQGPWPRNVADWLRAQGNQTGKLNLIRYRLAREAQGVAPLPDNAKTFLDGLVVSEAVKQALTPATSTSDGSLNDTEKILDHLIDWRLKELPSFTSEDRHRAVLFDRRISKALAISTGTTLMVSSPDHVLVPGTVTSFTVSLANTGSRIVKVQRTTLGLWVENAKLDVADQLLPDTETSATIERATPENALITVPKRDHLYDGMLSGRKFLAHAQLEIYGARFNVRQEFNREVAPAIEIRSISPTPYVWTPGTEARPLLLKTFLVNNTAKAFRGMARVTSRSLRIFEFGQEVSLAPNETREVLLQPAAGPTTRVKSSSTNSALATVTIEEQESRKLITQRAIRVIYARATAKRNLRVGYLPSFDQTLEHALAALGADATSLTVDDVQNDELSLHDTIIIDNRGYEAHPGLISANAKLLEFVENGGNLVVFYHKDNEWNPDERKGRPQLAPYPILLDDDRVTDETAPIAFLQPRHPLLTTPNRITKSDFDNWIQERGLYYPKEWDARYTTLLSTNDPGEKPLTGGLLVVRYGKGTYIYTSMVWYRQLREGVPGAFRMFANMISYGRR
ncbi:MAG TPA: PIG-L family deacetylase [Pyrinomonadaceae bacterium]